MKNASSYVKCASKIYVTKWKRLHYTVHSEQLVKIL